MALCPWTGSALACRLASGGSHEGMALQVRIRCASRRYHGGRQWSFSEEYIG